MAEGEAVVSRNLDEMFNSAASYVKSIVHKLTNQQILEFYGLFKQATEGSCTKPKPSWYELIEKQKWEAWSQLKNLNSVEAKEKYIFLLNQIDPNWEEQHLENSNGWIHHSCMKNEDEVIADSKKTIFDWVKEKNLEKVKSKSYEIAEEINKLDDNGMSLLHWAADRGSLEIVKYFVEHLKADVNVQDCSGQTPLHYAVTCEYSDVEKYLINSGADKNVTDNDGQTPYDAKM